MKIFDIKHIKELFKLALPIIMGNLGIVLLGAADCVVAGRYSTSALASISIANAIHAVVMMLGVGLTIGISPLLSNKLGAGMKAKRYFYPSLKFALIMALILTAITFAYIPLLDYLGYEAQLLHDIKLFTFIVAFSIVGVEISVALKEFLQTYEIVMFPNLLMILSVILDFILNYIFVFGLFGFPEMGVAGIALATTIIRLFTSLVMIIFCFINFKFKNYSEPTYYKQLIKIGLPISTAIMIEFLAFNYIAIMLGKVSGVYAAAHNIILVLINTSFMVPLGLSNALAVKIGFTNGAKNYAEMITYIKNGLGTIFIFMFVASSIFAIFPKILVSIFTSDKNIINIIVPIMYIVAIFQLSDGLQATLAGIFKVLKKTKFVMFANFIAYLIIGVSLGTFFGISSKMYLFGCWLAICISSILLSSILGICLYKVVKNLKEE